ncbi:Selenocysteine lyase/Cysteine desulfurase [Ekhidna lutea]|uniref:Selenocysteine lyase/Cysteine desulfurase n=1 Tax=Ekhidna lutea TaxID=447679 RepID=A0A239HSR5_EKHLU|nr:aminotransferase class V-fold PLP-dependent enzyme [Ekhidna lutea]SNS83324.1 Selenocysteine lyase/Cysteine desulfurase [Ekhidna lutea]
MLIADSPITTVTSLESYFETFRKGIIGQNQYIETDEKVVKMLYADWTASGRCYKPIEDSIQSEVLPFIGNTHTETNYVGSYITDQYLSAREQIKRHVNANEDDVLISSGSGMTDGINKLQRILGLRIPESNHWVTQSVTDKPPVVFITHMEHHSNHTSWLETICEVIVVPPDECGCVSVDNFKEAIEQFSGRVRIASITACSNVTGIETPYHEIAKLMHESGGYCFVDFACSAPYVDMDMHPDEASYLDAIMFSPHKFLGGPGASGILIVNKKLINNAVPDVSGGGTVDWTNPWGGRKYVADIEAREDGGTPAILQTIRAAKAVELKEQMGSELMLQREKELMEILWEGLDDMSELVVLADHVRERLGIISFYIEGVHYNDVVQYLNDHYGIQVRGGCSCAGTYGHFLLDIDRKESKRITDLIDQGDVTQKPGWVRLSIHPTMTDEEMQYIIHSIKEMLTSL